MRECILKYALHNAIKHEGKASVGAVISKVLGSNPEFKQRIRDLQKEAAEIINDVNS